MKDFDNLNEIETKLFRIIALKTKRGYEPENLVSYR
jgi:predicted DNA-binding WGR domain protein